MNKTENEVVESKIEKIRCFYNENNFFSNEKITDEQKQKSFAFVVFSLSRSLFNDDMNEITEYITDGANDCNIDALYFEDTNDEKLNVHVYQMKYKGKTKIDSTIGKNEIDLFIDKINKIFITGKTNDLEMNEKLSNKLKEFEDIQKNFIFSNIQIILHLITNGAELNNDSKIALNELKSSNNIIDWKFDNTYDFFVDNKKDVGEIQVPISDEHFSINNTHIVNLKAYDIAELYEKYQDTILDKNVRKLLSSNINDMIKDTLKNDPEMFWYKNNGLSIVTKRAEIKTIKGHSVIIMDNPYIVNGGQTTKTIYNLFKEMGKEAETSFPNASVMARIYQTTDDEKISEIVYGTNNQNRITLFDLKSGKKQLKILKEFFKENNIDFIYKQNSEVPASKDSIRSETLLQAYCSIYEGIPHFAKSNTTRLIEKYFDTVYDDERNSEKLLNAYRLFNFSKTEAKKHTEKFLIHSRFSILYLMSKIDPTLLKTFDKTKAGKAYKKAIEYLTKILENENCNNNNSFSFHNFFKSEKSTRCIDDYLRQEKKEKS